MITRGERREEGESSGEMDLTWLSMGTHVAWMAGY